MADGESGDMPKTPSADVAEPMTFVNANTTVGNQTSSPLADISISSPTADTPTPEDPNPSPLMNASSPVKSPVKEELSPSQLYVSTSPKTPLISPVKTSVEEQKSPSPKTPPISPVKTSVEEQKSPSPSPAKPPVFSPVKSPNSSSNKLIADAQTPPPLPNTMPPMASLIITPPVKKPEDGRSSAAPKSPVSPHTPTFDTAPDHSPIEPGRQPKSHMTPPAEKLLETQEAKAAGVSPISVANAPRSPNDLGNTPCKDKENDKKTFKDRLRDFATSFTSKFKKADEPEEERYLLAIDFDGTISERNTYSSILRRMMISAEELPADMAKERDELNQPRNRQSLQPFYSKVIQYLAEHTDMDKNGMLDWLKEQMRPAAGMKELLCMAVNAPHIEVAIFSDSNTLFIETLLEHWDIPADNIAIFANGVTTLKMDDGREYVALTDHSPKKVECRFCRANLCKGTLLKEMKSKNKKFTRTVVVGDGEGDVCMALHGNTSTEDYICARRPRHSSSSVSTSSSLSKMLSGMQLSLCKIDVSSEVARGPSKNLGLKPPIDTNQVIYSDGRQLFKYLSLPVPVSEDGEPLDLPDVVSVYECKLELIEREKERQRVEKGGGKRSTADNDTPKKGDKDSTADTSK